MLDRVAISATPLRIICAALLVLLIVGVDQVAAPVGRAAHASAIAEPPCMHRTLRMRAAGLHQRYLMRDLVARRPLLSIDE